MSKTRKIIGFIGLILAMFMGALDATIVNIALPDIMKDLKTGLTEDRKSTRLNSSHAT